MFTNVVCNLSFPNSDTVYTFNFADLALHHFCLRMEFCNLGLHVQFCNLCFANLIDQLGVANFAYTLGSADLVYNMEIRFAYR